jgi:predicted nucleic acid-binding protein
LPIDIVSADRDLAELAGEIKATRKMSLADCFAAALAKQKKAEIYTGDPEFKEVETEIKVNWL